MGPDRLLTLWEQGDSCIPLLRGILLTAVARPDMTHADLFGMGLGRRDRTLLDLYIERFGPTMPCVIACPACQGMVEFDADARNFRTEYAEPPAPMLTTAAIMDASSAEELAVGLADADLENTDSQSDLRVAMSCPDCGHSWADGFDIVDYLWCYIAEEAKRLLAEIHSLARAYGWTEPEILALSGARRQTYLRMVQA